MAADPVAELKERLGRVALGCATFGREIDRATSFAIMDHALERGIRHFDTAPAYSDGRSESIVGDWLHERGARARGVLVATKVKPPFSPDAIAASLAASRARLRRTTLDLVYFHQWSDDLDAPGNIEKIGALIGYSGTAALGASNFTPAQLHRVSARLIRSGGKPIRAVQNNHNFAIRTVDAALVEVTREHKIVVVTYSPLGAGFLTGKHRHGVAPGSRFEVIPGHQKQYFTDNARRRLEQLENLARAARLPLPDAALTWVFQQPGIDCVLVGGRDARHIDQALEARDRAHVPQLAAPHA